MVKKKTNKSKVKIGQLNVEKETVKDLDGDEMGKVKGGDAGTFFCIESLACGPSLLGTCAGNATCAGRTCGKKCRP